MVCQSAGQTRFRALKHLNGTAGSATIIVKIIACFQPLQDCQVRYNCISFYYYLNSSLFEELDSLHLYDESNTVFFCGFIFFFRLNIFVICLNLSRSSVFLFAIKLSCGLFSFSLF